MSKKKIVLFVILAVILIIGLISTFLVIKHINYTKTYEYKFSKIGYNKNEIVVLKKNLKNKQLDKLLNKKYNKNTVKLVKKKYFIFNNLNSYLKYYKDNSDKSLTDVIAIINVGANNEFYNNYRVSWKILHNNL